MAVPVGPLGRMTGAFASRRRASRWAGVRVALIGCGSIGEMGHLPGLRRLGVAPAALIDRNLERAESLRAALPRPGESVAAADYGGVLDAFDAAIVALPHHLHAPVATDLLARGKHVLLEKPMAVTPEECDEIARAAAESGAVLAVGMIRRFWDSASWTREALRAGVLGQVVSFDIRDGARTLALASDFALRRETAGGGVLMNLGVHVLDQVLWWFGPVRSFEYRDDSYGGVEVNCLLNLVMESGARGVVELSFNRQMRNTAVIHGTRGELEVDLYGHGLRAEPRSLLSFEADGMRGDRIPPSSTELGPIFAKEIADWLDAIVERRPPRVTAYDGPQEVAELVQACYAARRPLDLPWERPRPGTPRGDGGRTGGRPVAGSHAAG